MGYEELRQEWESNRELRKMVQEKCGVVCCNCGSADAIEYHHIVPLLLGGTNNIGNIVALCHKCHCAAHKGRHISEYQNKDNAGRPNREVDDNYFDAYVNGIIGTSELKELADIPDKTHLADLAAYKEYKSRNGIKKIRNNIDILLNKRGSIEEGEDVGIVVYEDGTEKTMRYKSVKQYLGNR